MKTIMIAGNIGRDAVVRRTQGGDAVTGWTVAVEDRQAKTTVWFDCSMWGSRGEKLAEYLTKGSKVAVCGDFGTREHDGKTYMTIRVDQVTLMGGGQREDRPAERSRASQAGHLAQRPDMDDEIPFIMEWR